MAFRNIALSGRIGVGGTSLAKALSQKLSWPLRDASQIFRDIAAHLGYNLELSPQQYSDDIDRKVDAETQKLLQSDRHGIVASKLAGFLSRDIAHTYRVLIVCPLEVRIKRYSQDRGYTLRDAHKLLLFREEEDQKKFGRLYGTYDFFDPTFFHLTLDSSMMTVHEEVERIIGALAALSQS